MLYQEIAETSNVYNMDQNSIAKIMAYYIHVHLEEETELSTAHGRLFCESGVHGIGCLGEGVFIMAQSGE